MRSLITAIAASLALVPCARAEGIVPCSEFKAGWQASLKRLSIAPSGPAYARVAGQDEEQVTGIGGVDASVTCRDGTLAHLELTSTSDPLAFGKASTSVLMALDRKLSPEAAASRTAALKTESEAAKRDAAGEWGPYELTWTFPEPAGKARFILDLAEN